MKQQVINSFARHQKALDEEILAEALNGFGMNRHQNVRFKAELTKRMEAGRFWGRLVGTGLGLFGVGTIAALLIFVLSLIGAL